MCCICVVSYHAMCCLVLHRMRCGMLCGSARLVSYSAMCWCDVVWCGVVFGLWYNVVCCVVLSHAVRCGLVYYPISSVLRFDTMCCRVSSSVLRSLMCCVCISSYLVSCRIQYGVLSRVISSYLAAVLCTTSSSDNTPYDETRRNERVQA